MKEIVNMEKNFKHRTIQYEDVALSKLDRPVVMGEYIKPLGHFVGFTSGRYYIVRDGDLINEPYIKNDRGDCYKVSNLDMDKWFIRIKNSWNEVFDHIKEGSYIAPKESYSVFRKGDNHIIFMDDEKNPYILDKEEKKHYLYKMNLFKWRKVTNHNKDTSNSYIIPNEKLGVEEWERASIPHYEENPYIMHCSGSPNVANLSKGESSGGSVNYYKVEISNPISPELSPCVVEFEDIALALGLTPMEYNIMKDLWRNANARTNGNGKAGNTQLRTYQKASHYSNILLKLEERK